MLGHARPGALRRISRHSFLFQTSMSSSKQAKPLLSSTPRASARRHFTPSVLALALSSALALPGSAFAVDWVRRHFRDLGGQQQLESRGDADGEPERQCRHRRGQVVLVDGTNAVANTLLAGTAAGSTGAVSIITGGLLAVPQAPNWAQPRTPRAPRRSVARTQPGPMAMPSASAGSLGTGTLDIERGRCGAPSGSTIVGQSCGQSIGTVTVDGTGSQLMNTAGLTVGDSGTGSLTITNGGIATNAVGLGGGDCRLQRNPSTSTARPRDQRAGLKVGHDAGTGVNVTKWRPGFQHVRFYR